MSYEWNGVTLTIIAKIKGLYTVEVVNRTTGNIVISESKYCDAGEVIYSGQSPVGVNMSFMSICYND